MARIDFYVEILIELMDMFNTWCNDDISNSTLEAYLDSLLDCEVFTKEEHYCLSDWLTVSNKATVREDILDSLQEWFEGKK